MFKKQKGNQRGWSALSKGGLEVGVELCRSWAAQGFKESAVYFINYLWPRRVCVAVCGLSLVDASGGYSSVVVHGLLIVVASLIEEHGL